MRTDPRKACVNKEERLVWALVHDGIAHPLMSLTFYSVWSVWFHDWTSIRAWPRGKSSSPKPLLTTECHTTAEWFRHSMRAQGLPVWSRCTPLDNGKFKYEVGRS